MLITVATELDKVTPAVQKSASVDCVEKKKFEVSDETETESEGDKEPPSKRKQTEQEVSTFQSEHTISM